MDIYSRCVCQDLTVHVCTGYSSGDSIPMNGSALRDAATVPLSVELSINIYHVCICSARSRNCAILGLHCAI